MGSIQLSDWVAIYAAFLSSTLAIVGLLRLLLEGPRLSVVVINPRNFKYGGKAFLTIISNVGNVSVVVERLEFSFRTSGWLWRKEVAKAIFDESTSWSPSTKHVPVANKPNTTTEEPNIIRPFEELRSPAAPHSIYKSDEHWIRVTAFTRNSRKGFVGWAAPIPDASREDGTNDQK